MKTEKTFALIKPDGIQRSLIGDIIHRIERTGLKLIGIKFLVATEKQCWDHYAKDDAWFLKKGTVILENRQKAGLPVTKEAIEYGKDIIRGAAKFLTSGPSVAMVWQGTGAVGIVKKIVGGTEPLTSDVGTIRGDLTIDSYAHANQDDRCVRNLIHCSDQVDEALREYKIWFDEKELISYRLINEAIHYDVNLDGILE